MDTHFGIDMHMDVDMDGDIADACRCRKDRDQRGRLEWIRVTQEQNFFDSSGI
jgi:hypothetical protein